MGARSVVPVALKEMPFYLCRVNFDNGTSHYYVQFSNTIQQLKNRSTESYYWYSNVLVFKRNTIAFQNFSKIVWFSVKHNCNTQNSAEICNELRSPLQTEVACVPYVRTRVRLHTGPSWLRSAASWVAQLGIFGRNFWTLLICAICAYVLVHQPDTAPQDTLEKRRTKHGAWWFDSMMLVLFPDFESVVRWTMSYGWMTHELSLPKDKMLTKINALLFLLCVSTQKEGLLQTKIAFA